MFTVALLAVLSLTTRALPMAISPLPYNNDGLTECRIASDILSSGSLDYPAGSYYSESHSVITPVFNVILAFAASATGFTPFPIAQLLTAFISILVITGAFILCRQMTGSTTGALLGSILLSLLGTFVFLTGSVWKESIGMALFTLLMIAYAKRGEGRYLAMEVSILILLPFVHHFVAIVAYLTLTFLTVWSVVSALQAGGLRRRHWVDVCVLGTLSAFAYSYYVTASLDRLSYISSSRSIAALVLAYILLQLVMIAVLSMRKHSKLSFAAVPAVVVFSVFIWDYFNPVFPYVPGSSTSIFALVISISVLVGISWFGLEKAVESGSQWRAIPLALFMPLFVVLLFVCIVGFNSTTHQVLYRSFDFADVGMAVGVSAAIAGVKDRRRIVGAVAATVVVVALISFPFSYATQDTIGLRHDTQSYEVDAVDWIADNGNSKWILQSDERISYIALALHDYDKQPYLPDRIVRQSLLGTEVFYVLEEEWMTEGVNDYPRGHPILNETYVQTTLSGSNTLYVGGPLGNEIIVFCATTLDGP